MVEDIELEALRASWAAGEWRDRDAMRVGGHLFYPLRPRPGRSGLVALSREGGREPLAAEEERMFGALADQVAGALERLRLGRERDEARVAAESERLRTALLSSLSHDLKTPLASITGAVTALRAGPDLYDAAARDELTATIQDEAERMTRFVTNLLDMTRIEAGGIPLDREAVDIGEVVGTALQRTARVLSGHKVAVELAPTCRCCNLDAVLFEQVLVNLLDNAAKYAPPGSRRDRGRPPRGRGGRDHGVGRGAGPAGGRGGACLRQVLPGDEGRPAAGRHGLGPRDLPRLRRGARRADHGRQSRRPIRRGVHADLPGRASSRRTREEAAE